MSQVDVNSLATGYRLSMNDPERERRARGVDLGLQSGLNAETALALSPELTLPVMDWRSLAADAPTLSGLLAGDGAAMTTAAPFIGELWRQEKRLRRWNVRKPGEKPAQDRLGALAATFGSVYMGLKDVGRGLTALHKDFVGEAQKTLRDVNPDEVPGLDDASRAMLRDLNAVDLDALDKDVLPVFDWMKTFDQDVADASPFLRFVSDVFRSLPTTAAALIGGAAGGPVGAAAAGGSIIYGQSLDAYDNDPTVTADPEDRRLYALGNAVIQGGLEAVGAKGLLNAFRPRGARGKALKAWFEGVVREGLTEGAQEFPERFFHELARGTDLTDKEDVLHLLDVFTSSAFWKDAGYSALVGAAAGGLVTAPGLRDQRRAFAAQEAAFAAMPVMARNFPNAYRSILRRHVEAGNVSREVFVPSAAVEGLFQEDATSQDVRDFLEKAGVSPADYEAARASGAPVAIPFENIADVLNDERGQALRDRLDISPEQESVGAAVTAEIFESVQQGGLLLETMPEDARALEQIREELGLDELALDERAFMKQDVVDAIVNATAGNGNAYTAEQARAYADVIDAAVATFAATHGLTYRGAFDLIAPEFTRGDISAEEMDALKDGVREAATSPEATEQNVAWATNQGTPQKGQATPRMTLEERAPLLALVRGRLDGKSLKRDVPDAYRELMQTHGRALFRGAGKGGVAMDELANEAVSRGLLPEGADSSDLVAYLKRGRRELFQDGERNSLGVPLSRVTRIEGNITREELDAALSALAGKDLPNLIEGVTAQVNANQKRKLKSGKAYQKSIDNGFSSGEHTGVASRIANAWKWAAEAKRGEDKNGMPDVNIRRFVSALNINGQDAFAWLTVKETPKGLRIYSVELMDENKLRGILGSGIAEATTDAPSGRSFEEIINRLNTPVNEQGRILFQSAYHGSPRREGITRKPDSATARVVSIPENAVPEFSGMKDFANWLKDMLAEGGNVTILSTRQEARRDGPCSQQTLYLRLL